MKLSSLFLMFFLLFSCKQKNDSINNIEKEKSKNITANTAGITTLESSIIDEPFKDLIAEFEASDRVIWQKPNMVIKLLGDLSGKTVADIGAGSGYFAFRMVKYAKKVIAIDVDPSMIEWMDSISIQKLSPEELAKFETRLAGFTDSHLKKEEVDAIVIVNTYHQIENRIQYASSLKTKLKPNGTLLIIDFKKRSTPNSIGPPQELRVAVGEVENELKAAGFDNISINDRLLDYQYIILAGEKLID